MVNAPPPHATATATTTSTQMHWMRRARYTAASRLLGNLSACVRWRENQPALCDSLRILTRSSTHACRCRAGFTFFRNGCCRAHAVVQSTVGLSACVGGQEIAAAPTVYLHQPFCSGPLLVVFGETGFNESREAFRPGPSSPEGKPSAQQFKPSQAPVGHSARTISTDPPRWAGYSAG